MGRTILGAVVGGVVLFVWGFIFWAVLPFGNQVVLPVANEGVVAEVLGQNIAASGVYYIPGEGAQEMTEAWQEKHKAGPVVQIFYRREGSDPNGPMFYLRGFGYLLLLALLMAMLLRQTGGQLETYGSRALFVLVAGVFAAAVGFSGAVWWNQSLNYHLLYAVYNVSSWFFAGLGMAAVIKPE